MYIQKKQMNKPEAPFDEKQSLQLIHEMIQKTKSKLRGDAFNYLLWGWLVFIASSSQFIWISYFSYTKQSNAVWLLMPIGLTITIIHKLRKKKKEKVNTYMGNFLRQFWLGFTITIILVSVLQQMPYHQFYATLMCFYGLGLFVSGRALEFRPIQLGGIWCWICSAIGFYIHNGYILLLLSGAVLGGYIIPGYLLKYSKQSE